MFDDAEKKIARLIADCTTTGESRSGLSKIKVKGRNNFVALGDVTVTVNIHQMNIDESAASAPLRSNAAISNEVALDRARQLISTRCEELGDPLLYRPFIKSLFKADRLDALGPSQLARVEWWLGLRPERPVR